MNWIQELEKEIEQNTGMLTSYQSGWLFWATNRMQIKQNNVVHHKSNMQGVSHESIGEKYEGLQQHFKYTNGIYHDEPVEEILRRCHCKYHRRATYISPYRRCLITPCLIL